MNSTNRLTSGWVVASCMATKKDIGKVKDGTLHVPKIPWFDWYKHTNVAVKYVWLRNKTQEDSFRLEQCTFILRIK